MITISNCTKVYSRTSSDELPALCDINLSLPDCGLVFILGKSGCGKTTLLNLLAGIDTPTSGDIVVDGTSIIKMSQSQLDVYRNKTVGMVCQDYNLLADMTVGDNVALALRLQRQGYDKKSVRLALDSVGLHIGLDRKTNEISGGQKQRVAIARAIVKSPKIVLADEPTGNLDSATAKDIYDLLLNISKTKLVVVVSHDVESAKQYGEYIV